MQGKKICACVFGEKRHTSERCTATMSASFTLGGFIGTNNVSNTLTSIAEFVKQTCDSNNTTNISAKNISIVLDNEDCDHINAIVQTQLVKTSCVNNATLKAIVQNLVTESGATTTKGAGSFSMNLFGSNVTMNSTNARTKISQAFKNNCSNNTRSSESTDNAKFVGVNLSCDSLNILSQHSSITSLCYQSAFASTISKNKDLLKGETTKSGINFASLGGTLIICCTIFAILATLGTILIIHHRHKVKAKLLAMHKGVKQGAKATHRHMSKAMHDLAHNQRLRQHLKHGAKAAQDALHKGLQHHHHHHHHLTASAAASAKNKIEALKQVKGATKKAVTSSFTKLLKAGAAAEGM